MYGNYFRKYILQDEENGNSGGGGATTTVVTPPAVQPVTQVAPPASGDSVSAYERELRNENATYRSNLKLKEAEVEAAKQEAAKLKAELEATKAETVAKLTETETRLKEEFSSKTTLAKIKDAVKEVLLDPDELDAMDVSGLKVAENGKVEGLEDFLGKLKSKRPYIFADYHAPQNSTASFAHRSVNPADPAPVDAMTMTDAEYRAAKRKLTTGKK